MSAARTSAWLALYLSAAFAFLIERGFLGTPRAPDLARLPARLGPLTVLAELAFDPAALGQQPPESFTFRLVRDAEGHEGRLFMAYYERAQRWSGRPHDVEKCFTALGWEEREAHRLAGPERPWSRLFERVADGGETESIRVLHWLEHPGPACDPLALDGLGARLTSARGLRPDVVSVYFEFSAAAAPDERDSSAAVAALSSALAELWP